LKTVKRRYPPFSFGEYGTEMDDEEADHIYHPRRHAAVRACGAELDESGPVRTRHVHAVYFLFSLEK
jgi:hypothetical protein